MKSIFENVKAIFGIAPIAQGASEILSAAIDTLGFHNAMVEVKTGAATGTPTSYAVAAKVVSSDTAGGTYTDVTDATASITADGKHAQIKVTSLGMKTKRFLKVSLTPSFVGGTTPKALIAATVLLGGAENVAVSNSATQA